MDFFEQLNEYKTKTEQRKHFEAKLSELEYIKNQLDMKLPLLRERMLYEQSDVDRLNEHSFSALISFISGKRKEMLDKEKAEALEAIMKYDAAMTQLNEVENNIRKTKNELRHIDRCEEKYNDMLKDLEKEMAKNSVRSKEILVLENEIAKVNALIKEYEEAIDAGNKLLASAKSVYESLEKARNIESTENATFGLTRMVFSSEQLEYVEYVVTMGKRMQVQLNDFRAELADVGLDAEIKTNINASLSALTYIDNFIYNLDIISYSSINSSKKDILKSITEITSILGLLNKDLTTYIKQKNKLQKKINDIILKQ